MNRFNIIEPDMICLDPDGEYCLAIDVAELEKQLADLHAILPKTADGVPVVPGMTLYQEDRSVELSAQWLAWEHAAGKRFPLVADCWFSTRQAAEKARG